MGFAESPKKSVVNGKTWRQGIRFAASLKSVALIRTGCVETSSVFFEQITTIYLRTYFDNLFISSIEKYLANTLRGSEKHRETIIIIQAVSKELLEHVGITFQENRIFWKYHRFESCRTPLCGRPAACTKRLMRNLCKMILSSCLKQTWLKQDFLRSSDCNPNFTHTSKFDKLTFNPLGLVIFLKHKPTPQVYVGMTKGKNRDTHFWLNWTHEKNENGASSLALFWVVSKYLLWWDQVFYHYLPNVGLGCHLLSGGLFNCTCTESESRSRKHISLNPLGFQNSSWPLTCPSSRNSQLPNLRKKIKNVKKYCSTKPSYMRTTAITGTGWATSIRFPQRLLGDLVCFWSFGITSQNGLLLGETLEHPNQQAKPPINSWKEEVGIKGYYNNIDT